MLLADAKKYNTWANIYFSAHLFRSTQRDKEYALPTHALWMDKDQGQLGDLNPKPTLCWQTSQGKYQVMWLLESPVSPTEVERLNRFLTYTCLGEKKGDKGGWHLGKMLRFPESVNYKYSPAQVGSMVWADGPTYTFEELSPLSEDEGIKDLIADFTKPAPTPVPSTVTTPEEVYRKYGHKITEKAWKLLQATPAPEDDWSDNLWLLENLLLEASIPAEAVFILVKESPWNKYRRDGRSDTDLWVEVLKAAHSKDPTPTEAKGLPWYTLGSLMDYSRKPEWLVQDIWMDENVGWLAGVGKSYKSTLSLDLALSIASGKPFLGKYEVLKPGPVLMVQEEDPVWRVAHRIRAMATAKEIIGNTLSYDDYSFSLNVPPTVEVPLHISIGGGFGFNSEDKLKDLEEAIKEHKPRMVFLDPWFMMAQGIDEFKSGDVSQILTLLKHWRNKYGCSICILHHFKKGNGEATERLYGSMALYAWSENSFFVRRERADNRVLIERDIKDALEQEKITVEFVDIDEAYVIKVSTTTEEAVVELPTTSTKERLIDYLVYQIGVGNYCSKPDIISTLRITPKTASKVIGELLEEEYIEITYQGRGNKMYVMPLERIRTAPQEVLPFGS